MPHTTAVDVDTVAALDVVTAGYAAERSRVDTTFWRMLATTPGRQAPTDMRRAAADLTAASRAATTTASEALRPIAPAPPPRTRRLRRNHRRASRSVPAPVPDWSAEFVRLTQIAVWAQRETLDDLGVRLPAVVRLSSLAATGPHIAGTDAEPAERVGAAANEPRIGVDLAVDIDRVEPDYARSRAASAAEPSAPQAAWAR